MTTPGSAVRGLGSPTGSAGSAVKSKGTTQNGFPIDPPLAMYTIPGTSKKVQLIADQDAALILLYVLGRWHKEVESVVPDTGGYGERPIGGLGSGGTSNHRSGTAVDIRWESLHPAWTNTTSPANQVKIRGIIAQTDGCIRWGYDFNDDQHIELTSTALSVKSLVAGKIRAGILINTPAELMTTQPAGDGPTGLKLSSAFTTALMTPTQIAKLPGVQVIPYRGLVGVNDHNRFDQVMVAGHNMSVNLVERVLSAEMSYSAQQVGQFTMVVLDTDDGELQHSQVFRKGMSLDFADQHCDIRSVAVQDSAGLPQITVQARSHAVSRLRSAEQTGAGAWPSITPAQWVIDRCDEAGAIPAVQPGIGGDMQITRGAEEDTWTVMVRLAQTLGVTVFEADQRIYFGKPSWLVTRQDARRWEANWSSTDNHTSWLTARPAFTESQDQPAGQQQTLRLQVWEESGHLARPGDAVVLDGSMGAANGEWWVTSVLIPVKHSVFIELNCSRVVDPAPQPPAGVLT